MKVVTIFGGPRKKGNTATMLEWVEEAVEVQVERQDSRE